MGYSPWGLKESDTEHVGTHTHTRTHTHTHTHTQRIVTQETVLQKALRTVLPLRGQSTVIHMFETKRVIRQMMC